jgi:hypothetical protein
MRQPLEYFYFLCYFEKKSSFAAGAYCSTQRRWRLRQGAGTVARSRPCMIHAVLLGVGGLVYEGRCFTGWAGLAWPAEGKEEVHFLRRVVTCPGTVIQIGLGIYTLLVWQPYLSIESRARQGWGRRLGISVAGFLSTTKSGINQSTGRTSSFPSASQPSPPRKTSTLINQSSIPNSIARTLESVTKVVVEIKINEFVTLY